MNTDVLRGIQRHTENTEARGTDTPAAGATGCCEPSEHGCLEPKLFLTRAGHAFNPGAIYPDSSIIFLLLFWRKLTHLSEGNSH